MEKCGNTPPDKAWQPEENKRQNKKKHPQTEKNKRKNNRKKQENGARTEKIRNN